MKAAFLLLCVFGLTVGINGQTSETSETPAAFYERYLATVETAKTLEGVSALWSESMRAQLKAPNTPAVSLDMVRTGYSVSGVKVVGAVPVRNNDVRLMLEGTSSKYGRKATGSVVVTKENGAWKLADFGGWTIHAAQVPAGKNSRAI